MIIREASMLDAEGIAKVQVETWKTAYKNIFPQSFLEGLSYCEKSIELRKWLENLEETTKVFVCESESNQIIGFAVGGLERENHPEYKGELWGIYILQKYQRNGIGTELIERIVHYFLENEITSMLLWVLKENPYRFFYQRLGGNIINEKEKNWGPFRKIVVSYGWKNIETILNKYDLIQ